MMQYLLSVGVAVFCVFVVHKYFAVRKALRAVHYHPGDRTLLSRQGLGSVLPHIPYISSGANAFLKHERNSATYYGSEILASVSVLPTVRMAFTISDPVAIKEVIGSRARFPKPLELYTPLLFFGKNIVASEHDEWKRFRKVAAPAFTEPNNKLVWDETIHVINDLFTSIWGDEKEIVVDHILDILMPATLFIISAAAFGHRINWKDEIAPPTGHRLTFKDALHTFSNDYLFKLLLPNWTMHLTQRLRKVNVAFEEMEQYMAEIISDRKNHSGNEKKYDLLSGLLDASEGEFDGDGKLTDSEVLGNTFIFLVAGHETTAHTLCFAFGLLAMYPEEQETLYQEIKSVLADGRLPTYDDMNSLVFTNAVFNETLRMFPPVNGIPKYSAEDTVLPTTNSLGEKILIPIPKGSGITIHTPGLHYNSKYWNDPDTFKPSRFLGDWPRDAFLPFSGGVRSCLGRRFAELESVVALTLFVSRYKIDIKDEPQFSGETFEERKERIFSTKPRLTMTPIRIPLVFRRR